MSAKLIVALDVDTFAQARALVRRLFPTVKMFKVGSQLFTACGPAIIKYIRKNKGADVFLDLKFHDIPNTVANAVRSAVGLDVFMLTVHAQGGAAMLRAATKAARQRSRVYGLRRCKVIAVTVLTSQSGKNVGREVLRRARMAQASGCDGVVASARECAVLRRALGKRIVTVTPGIRPTGGAQQDQKRVATAQDAVRAGSSFLVVGRPIVTAANPLEAARRILKEMSSIER